MYTTASIYTNYKPEIEEDAALERIILRFNRGMDNEGLLDSLTLFFEHVDQIEQLHGVLDNYLASVHLEESANAKLRP